MSQQLSSRTSSSPKSPTPTPSSPKLPIPTPAPVLPPSSSAPSLSHTASAHSPPAPSLSHSAPLPSASSSSGPAPIPSASGPTPTLPAPSIVTDSTTFTSTSTSTASPASLTSSSAAPSPAASTSSIETSGSITKKRGPKKSKVCPGEIKFRQREPEKSLNRSTESKKRKAENSAPDGVAKKPRAQGGSVQKGLRQSALSRSAAQIAAGVTTAGLSPSATASGSVEQDTGMPEGQPFFQLPQSLSRRTTPRGTTRPSPAPSSQPRPPAENPVASASTSHGAGERTSNGASVASRDASFTSSETNPSPVPANESYEFNTEPLVFGAVNVVASASHPASSSTATSFISSTSAAAVPAFSNLSSASSNVAPFTNHQASTGDWPMGGNYASQPPLNYAPPAPARGNLSQPRAYNANTRVGYRHTSQHGQVAQHHRLAPQTPTARQVGHAVAQGQNVAPGSVGNVGGYMNNNPHFQRQLLPQAPFAHPSQQNTSYTQQTRFAHHPQAQQVARGHFPSGFRDPANQQQHNTGFALPTPQQVQQAVHRVYPGSFLEWEEGIPVVVRPPAAQDSMQSYIPQEARQMNLPMAEYEGQGVGGMTAGYGTGQQIPPSMGSVHEEPALITASTFFPQHAPAQQPPVQRFAPQADDVRQGYRSMPGYEEGAGITGMYGMGQQQQQQQQVASTSFAHPPPAQASGHDGQSWDVDLLQAFSQTQQAGSAEYGVGQQLQPTHSVGGELVQPAATFAYLPAAQASEEVGHAWDESLFQDVFQTPVVGVGGTAMYGAEQLLQPTQSVEEQQGHAVAGTSFVQPALATQDSGIREGGQNAWDDDEYDLYA